MRSSSSAPGSAFFCVAENIPSEGSIDELAEGGTTDIH